MYVQYALVDMLHIRGADENVGQDRHGANAVLWCCELRSAKDGRVSPVAVHAKAPKATAQLTPTAMIVWTLFVK